ncbi:hypothetical protein E3N88_15511 [Mikania micrantha]|uniref:Uncharacterized protein n=1 Tax=Mikania micrantha TaxID=192012 RepID=A0A5N6NXF7_9ASTR|nr:hypothetical protein E3N88_15511 [Mikania micrantha]
MHGVVQMVEEPRSSMAEECDQVFSKSSTTVGLSTAGAGTTTSGTIGGGPSELVFRTTRPVKVNIIGSANLYLEMTEEKALHLDFDYYFLKLNPPMESFEWPDLMKHQLEKSLNFENAMVVLAPDLAVGFHGRS